jgi:hypothetical protein
MNHSNSRGPVRIVRTSSSVPVNSQGKYSAGGIAGPKVSREDRLSRRGLPRGKRRMRMIDHPIHGGKRRQEDDNPQSGVPINKEIAFRKARAKTIGSGRVNGGGWGPPSEAPGG